MDRERAHSESGALFVVCPFLGEFEMATAVTGWPRIRPHILSDAFALYQRHWVIYSLAQILHAVAVSATVGFFGSMAYTPELGALPGVILGAGVSGFITGGMVLMALNQIRGVAPRIEDLTAVGPLWFDLLLAGGLTGLASAIGYTFFIIPGFIVSGLFMLTIPLVVALKLPAVAAMKQSAHVFKDQWSHAAFWYFLLLFISSIGIAFFGIGIFVTGPLYPIGLALLLEQYFGHAIPYLSKDKASASSEL